MTWFEKSDYPPGLKYQFNNDHKQITENFLKWLPAIGYTVYFQELCSHSAPDGAFFSSKSEISRL